MKIDCFPSGPFATNAYLVVCEKTKISVILDPAPNSASFILEKIESEKLGIQQIWLTHSHWDHFADVGLLKEKLKASVLVHPLDALNLKSPGSDGLPLLLSIQAVEPDYFLKDGQILSVGDLEFLVIHTPGHSPGGVCFYCPKEKTLFSGDTLFKGSIGNLSFPTSNADEMWQSLEKLAKLPPDTKVFPGHGESTRLSLETWLPHAKEYFS